jgi:cellulose synthase operon protein C
MKLTRTRLLVAAAVVVVLAAVGAGVAWARWMRRPPPLSAGEAYALGQKHFDERRYAEAYRYLDRVAGSNPQNADYCWSAAQAALALGRKSDALPHLRAAWDAGLREKALLLALAECTSFKSSAERLKTVFEWLKKFPEGPVRRELEGDFHFEAGRFDEAVLQWQEAGKVAPSGRLTTKAAMAHLRAGKRDAAQTLLQSRRGTPLLDEDGYGLLAVLLADRDDSAGAEAAFAEGAKAYPDGESLRLTRATYFVAHDRPAEAAEALEPMTSRSKDPEQEARRHGARLLLTFVRAARADAAGVRALAALAEGDEPWLEGERLFAGVLLARLDGRNPIAEDLKRLRALVGSHPAVLWAAGREYARAGTWAEASSAFRSVAGPLARAPVFLVEFAQVLRRSGKPNEALQVLQRLHGRGISSRSSLELARDLSVELHLPKESAQAQKMLEERFHDDPAVLLAGGVMALRSGNLAEAASALQALSSRFPEREDVEAARLSVFLAGKDYEGLLRAAAQSKAPRASLAPFVATALSRLGRAAEAEKVLEAAVADRAEPRLLVEYANLLLSNGKPEAARARYEAVLRAQPKNDVARLGLATLALQAGDVTTSRTLAEDVAGGKGSGAAYAHTLIAELDLRQGRADRALAAANLALGLDAADDRARFLQAVATLELGRAEEAEHLLQRSVAARPDVPALQWHFARAKAARGATGEALAIVDAVLARKPAEDAPFLALRMILLGLSGKEEEAKAALAGLSPKLRAGNVLICEAWLLARGGKAAEAAERLRPKLEDPDVAQAWADVTLRQGKAEGVLQALEPHALDAARWIRLAETARANGLPAVAVALYRKALRTDKDNPALLNNLAYVSLQLDAYDAAEVVAFARKAVDLAPKNISILHTYATALLRTGKERDCISLLQKDGWTTDRSAKLLLVLAQAYDKVGDKPAALRTYTVCLNHPDTVSVAEGDLSRPALEKQVERLRIKK